MSSESKPIVLLTGSNGGLGTAIVKSLCESATSYHILVGCRSIKKSEDTIATVKKEVPDTKTILEVLEIELESDESIQKAFEKVSSTHSQLDVLINNGGYRDTGKTAQTTREIWNNTWNVNVTGTHILTETFAPLLLRSNNPRLLFMTSGTACLAETGRTDKWLLDRLNAAPAAGWPKDVDRNGAPAYRSAKTGMNMMMREWCRWLKEDGVKVFAVSPGFLATGLGGIPPDVARKMGAGEPSEGANFIRDVIEGKKDQYVGLAIRSWEVQEW